MPKCGIEFGLRDVDLESDLHDRMNGGLDGYMLNCPTKGCRSNVGEHDLVRYVRWSRGGWLSLESRLVVDLKVQVHQRQGQVVLEVHDQLVCCPEVHLVLRQWVGSLPLPSV